MKFGKIFGYDTVKSEGLIVFEDGEQHAFRLNEWKSFDTIPAVGLDVVFEDGMLKAITVQEKKTLVDMSDPDYFIKTLIKENQFVFFPQVKEYFEKKSFNVQMQKDSYLSLEKISTTGVEKIFFTDTYFYQLNEDGKTTNLNIETILSQCDNLNLDELISQKNLNSSHTPESVLPQNDESSREINNNDVYGIVSMVLSILGFLFLGIILWPLSLYFGLTAQKPRTPFAMIGIIISGIGLGIMFLGLIGVVGMIGLL